MAGPEFIPAFDPLASIELLTWPGAAEFLASQLVEGSLNQNVAQGSGVPVDLTDAITDIVIETTAQGASVLTVHIADPWFVLSTRLADGSPAFIDVDDAGLLIPVDVNFPARTEIWWRLMAAEPSLPSDAAEANLVLTFEDRIVVKLRDLGGPVVAHNSETRAQFIARLVKQVPEIRFVCPALGQPAGSVGGNLTQGQIGNLSTPVSATQPNAPAARANPTKAPGINRGSGAVWTPHGWRYTKPINGVSSKILNILNPPTNQPDGSLGSVPTAFLGI